MKKAKRLSVSGRIAAGMDELEKLMREGSRPAGDLTARTVEVSAPASYGAREVKATRSLLGVSQEIFARLLGVSAVLVRKWERDERQPSPLACRVLDEMNHNPNRWAGLIHQQPAKKTA